MPDASIWGTGITRYCFGAHRALLFTSLLLLVSACGGGGDGTDSNSVPADIARLDCQVEDSSTGKAVADATVNYQARSSAFSAQTNADGSCRIDIPAAEVPGIQYPAATVSKAGYEPQTILCETLGPGRKCEQDVLLIPLAGNMSVPVGGDIVMHLGDDRFEGAANSQFQKTSDGKELVFPIADWADQVRKPGISKATVYLDAKGWQSNVCANTIGLSGNVGTVQLPGGVSPPEGYWAGGRQAPFEFDVAAVGPLNAELRIIAGTCNGTIDVDDFEINRIRVEFN